MITNPDLHLHTFFSDGREAPERVIERAVSAGCDVAAVTDHDGMDGVKRALEAGRKLGISVISGVEFSAELEADIGSGSRTFYMHLLAYGLDPDCLQLQQSLDMIKQKRYERNEKLLEVFKNLGYAISMEELLSHSLNGFAGKRSFARILVERGACRDINEAFASEKLLSNPEVKKIHKYKIPASDAIDLAKKAGGKVFLAHPYELTAKGLKLEGSELEDCIKKVLKKLKETGLAGMECYYPTHSPEQTEKLLKLAGDMELLVSRGSDDHGYLARPVRQMGNFAVKPDLSVLQWINDFV